MKNRKSMRAMAISLGVILSLSVSLIMPQAFFFFNQTTAYRFSVNGETWFTVQNKDDLNRMIEMYKQSFLGGIDADAVIESIDFVEPVLIEEVKVDKKELTDNTTAIAKLHSLEETPETYTVQKGDNLTKIASSYNLSVSDLVALNPDKEPDKIWPGDTLVIRASNPVLDVKIVLKNRIEEAIPFETETVKDDALAKNKRVIVTPGKEGVKSVLKELTLVNGLLTESVTLEETVLSEPVKAKVKIGTKVVAAVARSSGSGFKVVNGHISSNYGWRTNPISGTKRFHSGLDIAADTGTAVYAYNDGTVIFAGWDDALGNLITIDHGNGLITRYGHLSALNVSTGQSVSGGETIGAVGETGYATGPHLHFEVYQDGKTQNPLNYL